LSSKWAAASVELHQESKTPRGEHYLNPPGAEMLAWLKLAKQLGSGLSAGPA
jgi:hypothetical protein